MPNPDKPEVSAEPEFELYVSARIRAKDAQSAYGSLTVSTTIDLGGFNFDQLGEVFKRLHRFPERIRDEVLAVPRGR